MPRQARQRHPTRGGNRKTTSSDNSGISQVPTCTCKAYRRRLSSMLCRCDARIRSVRRPPLPSAVALIRSLYPTGRTFSFLPTQCGLWLRRGGGLRGVSLPPHGRSGGGVPAGAPLWVCAWAHRRVSLAGRRSPWGPPGMAGGAAGAPRTQAHAERTAVVLGCLCNHTPAIQQGGSLRHASLHPYPDLVRRSPVLLSCQSLVRFLSPSAWYPAPPTSPFPPAPHLPMGKAPPPCAETPIAAPTVLKIACHWILDGQHLNQGLVKGAGTAGLILVAPLMSAIGFFTVHLAAHGRCMMEVGPSCADPLSAAPCRLLLPLLSVCRGPEDVLTPSAVPCCDEGRLLCTGSSGGDGLPAHASPPALPCRHVAPPHIPRSRARCPLPPAPPVRGPLTSVQPASSMRAA